MKKQASRIEKLAEKAGFIWIRDYLRTNQQKTGRNNFCISEAGKSLKSVVGNLYECF